MKRLLLALAGLAFTFACVGGGGRGGGSTTPASPPAISVTLSPSAQTEIDQGQTVNFTATVANDSGGKGVTWSASSTGVSGTASGTFSNAGTTTATYNAPLTVSANSV